VKITDVFKLHPECFRSEMRALLTSGQSPFEFNQLRYVSSVEDSKAIDLDPAPAVIISASGMCEAGRVLHHLKATLEDPKNAIVIVGFQATHTLGRRLVEHRARVRLFGVERDVRAEVVVMNGFSAHADQSDLAAFASESQRSGKLRGVVLVHGEPAPQQSLVAVLRQGGITNVTAPAQGDRLTYP
jgi:metallo-beta-lactamase family protein